ncbi:hypothetical protein KOPIIPEJ_02172 [Aeromonas dhakensis]
MALDFIRGCGRGGDKSGWLAVKEGPAGESPA